MGELSKLPNIGPDTERLLNAAGISNDAQLRESGAEVAWLKIQAIDPSACVNRLLGLEGAIQNVKKTRLPEHRRLELREFYQKHKL